jgi:tRNA modification GTPase
MPTGGTIAAIGSPPGRSAHALIRISGDETRALVLDLCGLESFSRGIRRARFALTDADSIGCHVLMLEAPRSYTGEDSAEILLVGSPVILERAMNRICARGGVRRAEPGEFSARAYLNDRITLAQAEGVALRIGARTKHALGASDELLSGAHGQRCAGWVDAIATCLALVEAGVDFIDQDDVVAIAPRDLHDRLRRVSMELDGELGSAGGSRVRDERARVVLVGAPNAGKSTLFNTLLGRARSIVSDQPGTTRDAIEEILDLDPDAPGAGSVTLTDLAGLADQGIDAIDDQAQRRARSLIERADAIVWCDPTGRFDQSFAAPEHATTIRVRTKADLALSDDPGAMRVCALDGTNLSPLRRAIADSVVDRERLGAGAMVPRHRAAIRSAAGAIDLAISSVDPEAHDLGDPELVAAHLRSALDDLGSLVGAVSVEDVLGRVFATFCVGK